MFGEYKSPQPMFGNGYQNNNNNNGGEVYIFVALVIIGIGYLIMHLIGVEHLWTIDKNNLLNQIYWCAIFGISSAILCLIIFKKWIRPLFQDNSDEDFIRGQTRTKRDRARRDLEEMD